MAHEPAALPLRGGLHPAAADVAGARPNIGGAGSQEHADVRGAALRRRHRGGALPDRGGAGGLPGAHRRAGRLAARHRPHLGPDAGRGEAEGRAAVRRPGSDRRPGGGLDTPRAALHGLRGTLPPPARQAARRQRLPRGARAPGREPRRRGQVRLRGVPAQLRAPPGPPARGPAEGVERAGGRLVDGRDDEGPAGGRRLRRRAAPDRQRGEDRRLQEARRPPGVQGGAGRPRGREGAGGREEAAGRRRRALQRGDALRRRQVPDRRACAGRGRDHR
mmetsp:Transcript_127121/g.359812  ORF Transcript_127121/g.359812 Transcript_127121/m.359812 type:complete len:276 (+) Transcript_127121:844-1671(+)